VEFFERQIRPVLVEHCQGCHGEKKQQASLRLDSREGLLKGSDAGPVIVAGNPEASRLWQVLQHTGEVAMPPKAKLPDAVLADIRVWIERGAAWPAAAAAPKPEVWRSHWAFQPLRPPPGDLRSPKIVDDLIAARHRERGLTPAARADRRTLIRRATFDLHGLPPTYEQVQAFLNNPAPDAAAFAQLVDELLASPRFGQRWGRHWLDLARYADERGYIGVGVDRVYPFAWTYRDYVIAAFNRDLPYDRFLQEQIAADLLPEQDNPGPLAALGFFTIGRRFIGNIHDIIDDRIDVLTRTTLGLTVTCARCHDHKYDPVTMKDYYGLYGIFASTHEPDLEQLPLLVKEPSGPRYEEFARELERLKAERAKFEADHAEMKAKEPRKFEEQIKPFDNRIRQHYAKHPGAPPRAMVLRDNPQPHEPVVFLRGNPHQPGPKTARQFLAFLSPEPRPFTQGSGRLELAQQITRPDNPLTARVYVNRVWDHLLGQPLVPTTSDFGVRSEPPLYPELLDALAAGFIQDGWSTKRLLRRIMLSQAYQRQAEVDAATLAADPDGRLLTRQLRRRLDFEALRDSLLFVAGRLDDALGGPSVDLFRPPYSRRRTVYAFIDRQNLPGVLRTFDFALPDTHAPRRFTTTVPQQALFLMNHPFVFEQAKHLTARLDAEADTATRIRQLYRLVLVRDPSPGEVLLAQGFLTGGVGPPTTAAWEHLAQTLLMSNEFLHVD
jgi:hypothetical protein